MTGPCDGTWWVREERMDYVSCVEVSSDIEMIPYLKKTLTALRGKIQSILMDDLGWARYLNIRINNGAEWKSTEKERGYIRP